MSRDYLDGSPKREIPLGAYFGEMGVLLPRTPNLATVVAEEPTTLLYISKQDWPLVVPPPSKTPEETRIDDLRRGTPLGSRRLHGRLRLEQEWWLRSGGYGVVVTEWLSRSGGHGVVVTEWLLRTGGYGLVVTDWWLRSGG